MHPTSLGPGSGQTLTASDFGTDFIWGTATAAYQIEGAVDQGGRGPCIWDEFAEKKGRIKNNDKAGVACDFYSRFETDLEIAAKLGFKNFRFSVSWSRILPEGVGEINRTGIDFYNRLIDKCLALDLVPWLTLYHWDLPLSLEKRGGWKNREVVGWFAAYTSICAGAFGDRVNNWIVMNEPMATAGLGYTTGLHAPGKKGLWNFLPVVHHLALSQAEAGRVIRSQFPEAYIGTALSCSYVEPATERVKDIRAARRADALMNRLFIEPALGMGYPSDAFPYLAKIRKYMRSGDDEKLKFDFDFIGLQNYFNVVVRHSYRVPVLWLKEEPAVKRNKPVTAMGWEIAPEGMYRILDQFSQYTGIRDIIVTENGAAFQDVVEQGEVRDTARLNFFREYLAQVLKAKQEGASVKGYFAWTFLDNFEWAEGYSARFGLVYVDFETQERIVKDSGKWFSDFLQKSDYFLK
ncbi:1,4-beta-D-glucan glucohydrolase [Dyadobacter sp. CECT 9275]|uniref:Beta-glucosidase n=1 Tax=Dyadobacter helix TaxID=2822344 RepID=A0A916JEC9_9BACT|nr:GH1 family beta-glucosidase [Dyadobacter sp. CECT 9275]CAG5003411.1 1,4-beta-D-glucan glucohydrolase [Dyadobacter sp. CECT 9275]